MQTLEMDTLFDELEKASKDKDIAHAQKTLTYIQTHYPNIDTEETFNYLTYLAIEARDISFLKLVYHPLFSGDYHTDENIKCHIAHMVIELHAFDFIVPTVLASLSSMKDYTFEVINERHLELAQYILNDKSLDFDQQYLEEIYPNLFYQEDNGTALLLKNNIRLSESLIKNCLKEAITYCDSSNIDYLMQQHPDLTLNVIKNWFDYIKSFSSHSLKASYDLIMNEDHMGEFNLSTLTHVIELYKTHVHEEIEQNVLFYFLKPFIDSTNNEDKICSYVDYFAQTESVEKVQQLILYIQNYKKNSQKDFCYPHFATYYEKHQLECATNESTHTAKKLKL